MGRGGGRGTRRVECCALFAFFYRADFVAAFVSNRRRANFGRQFGKRFAPREDAREAAMLFSMSTMDGAHVD